MAMKRRLRGLLRDAWTALRRARALAIKRAFEFADERLLTDAIAVNLRSRYGQLLRVLAEEHERNPDISKPVELLAGALNERDLLERRVARLEGEQASMRTSKTGVVVNRRNRFGDDGPGHTS
jgi:hypothetical protein